MRSKWKVSNHLRYFFQNKIPCGISRRGGTLPLFKSLNHHHMTGVTQCVVICFFVYEFPTNLPHLVLFKRSLPGFCLLSSCWIVSISISSSFIFLWISCFMTADCWCKLTRGENNFDWEGLTTKPDVYHQMLQIGDPLPLYTVYAENVII